MSFDLKALRWANDKIIIRKFNEIPDNEKIFPTKENSSLTIVLDSGYPVSSKLPIDVSIEKNTDLFFANVKYWVDYHQSNAINSKLVFQAYFVLRENNLDLDEEEIKPLGYPDEGLLFQAVLDSLVKKGIREVESITLVSSGSALINEWTYYDTFRSHSGGSRTHTVEKRLDMKYKVYLVKE